MRSFLAQRPNLPPQQSSENQVEIGGQFRLAYASGRRMGTHHEQATLGKRGDAPAHKFPKPSLHTVANHRRADRTAYHEAYLRPGVGSHRTSRNQQVRRDRRGTSPASRAHRALELLRAPHPRLLRQHHTSCAAKAAATRTGQIAAPARRHQPGVTGPRLKCLFRQRADRGPCDGARPGRRGRRGYASAHGSHGPWPADGYSAGTCACSLELQIRFGKFIRLGQIMPDTTRPYSGGFTRKQPPQP